MNEYTAEDYSRNDCVSVHSSEMVRLITVFVRAAVWHLLSVVSSEDEGSYQPRYGFSFGGQGANRHTFVLSQSEGPCDEGQRIWNRLTCAECNPTIYAE